MRIFLAAFASLAVLSNFATGVTPAKQSAPVEKPSGESSAADSSSPFAINGYGSFDLVSGYEYRGSLMNDEPVYWTYCELNAAYADVASFGGWLFQNTDMTCRRKEEMRRMNEWDFGADFRLRPELVEGWRLGAEIGHSWCTMHGLRGLSDEYYTQPATELYAIIWVENPYVIPYCALERSYDSFDGTALSFGLRHTFQLPLGLKFTPEVAVGGSSTDYNEQIFPPFDGSVDTGLMFVRIGGELTYWVTEYFGFQAQAGFTVITNPDVRDAIDDFGNPYRNEFVCGGIGVVFAF